MLAFTNFHKGGPLFRVDDRYTLKFKELVRTRIDSIFQFHFKAFHFVLTNSSTSHVTPVRRKDFEVPTLKIKYDI